MYTLLGTGRAVPAAGMDEAARAAAAATAAAAAEADAAVDWPHGRSWISLPPEDASTVIMPRLTAGSGDATQVLPVLKLPTAPPAGAGALAEAPTIAMSAVPDLQATMVLPVLPESGEAVK